MQLAAVLPLAGESSMICLIFVLLFELHTIDVLQYTIFKLRFVAQGFALLILRIY